MSRNRIKNKRVIVIIAVVVFGLALTVFYYPKQLDDKVGGDFSNDAIRLMCQHPELGEEYTENYEEVAGALNDILMKTGIRRTLSLNRLFVGGADYTGEEYKYLLFARSRGGDTMVTIKVGNETHDSIVLLDEIFAYKVVDDKSFKNEVESVLETAVPAEAKN